LRVRLLLGALVKEEKSSFFLSFTVE
jgi:hypothetical protein